MPRTLRIEIPNGVYYVSTRGLERQGIVRDEGDCSKWFQLLDAVATRRRWRVFACVVMLGTLAVSLMQLRQNSGVLWSAPDRALTLALTR